jgi:hypothetical protein
MRDLAQIAKKKPEMTLTLTQFVNMKKEITEYALYKTKAAFLAARFKEEKRGTPDYDDVTGLDENDKTFEAYLDSLVKSRGVPIEGASLQEKVKSLYVPDSLQAELQRTLASRNELLSKHMIISYQIPPKNLIVKTAEISALDTYTDGALYMIEMTLPEGAGAAKNDK